MQFTRFLSLAVAVVSTGLLSCAAPIADNSVAKVCQTGCEGPDILINALADLKVDVNVHIDALSEFLFLF